MGIIKQILGEYLLNDECIRSSKVKLPLEREIGLPRGFTESFFSHTLSVGVFIMPISHSEVY